MILVLIIIFAIFISKLPRAQVIDCEDACSKTRLICNVEKKDECCKEKKKPKKEECSSGEESDPCEDEKESNAIII